MWPDRVSNRGPLTHESGALPTALRGPALLANTVDNDQMPHYVSANSANPDHTVSDLHLLDMRSQTVSFYE